MRADFFESLVGLATYIGWESSSILKPLLLQVSPVAVVSYPREVGDRNSQKSCLIVSVNLRSCCDDVKDYVCESETMSMIMSVSLRLIL